MEINQELITRYHLDDCTDEERRQVEAWLFNMDTPEEVELPATTKLAHRDQMWNEILASTTVLKTSTKEAKFLMWKGAIAASVVIAVMGCLYYFVWAKNLHRPAAVALNNSSQNLVKYIDASTFHASIGPNTQAKINNQDGVIAVSGCILIAPKEDIELVFEGTLKKVTLKKGQTYIILNNKSGTQGIIVVSEKNLLDLPPVIQKQITNQFDI